MQDPYRTLGISPSASEDEIKKAYRALAKKYHPDVNNGSPDAEARMKEINEAYSAIMKMRREGTTWNGGGAGGSGYGGYAGYGGYSGYGGYGRPGAGYGGASTNPHLQTARTYISQGRFQEAFSVLESVRERTAEWYYLSSQAAQGMGNRIAALNYARQAVSLDPNSFEYRVLLSQLEASANYYENGGATRGFNMPGGLCHNPILSCCAANILINLLCGCCCGGRPYYGGWYC